MKRCRVLHNGSMVVIKRSIRASSVPVAPSYSMTPFVADAEVAVATVGRISSAALDDTDAMMYASKRHDQQLLSDINARLASASFTQPAITKRSTTTTTSYSSTQPRDKPPLPTSRSHVPSHRRYLALARDDDGDLPRMPSTPVTTSVIRSSSVPPRLPKLPTRNGLSATVVRRHVSRADSREIQPEVYQKYDVIPVYGKVVTEVTNHPSFTAYTSSSAADAPVSVSLSPVADLAVRQAHRQLDRIDKEIKLSYPDGPRTFLRQAYVTDKPLVMARQTVIHGPATYGATRTRRTTSVSPSRTSIQHRYVPSPSPEDLLLFTALPASQTSSLSSRAYTSASPADTQTHLIKVEPLKSSLAEPEPALTLTNVYKSRTVPAMSYTSYVKPASTHITADVTATPVLPTRAKEPPPEYVPMPLPTGRPKLSETRRKVREVLCKVRNDPHYFDDY